MVVQGMLDSTWPVQLIGLEEKLRWKCQSALSQKVIKLLQMPLWGRELRPRCPQGTMKTNQTPAAIYNIKEWMQGLEEDASEVEVRNGDLSNCGTEWQNTYSQYVGRRRRHHRKQGAPRLLRDTSSGSPSSGEGVQIKEVIRVPISQP